MKPSEVKEALRETADLYGLRGCCRKNSCFHLKAKLAVERIEELEEAYKNMKEWAEKNGVDTTAYHGPIPPKGD